MLEILGLEKYIGPKKLYSNLNFKMEKNSKVGFIGRNGTGKTTLFNLISGKDSDYSGKVSIGRDVRVVQTIQEHYLAPEVLPIQYILDMVPKYRELEGFITQYEANPSSDMEEIQKYSDALSLFNELNFHSLEDEVLNSLAKYGIDLNKALTPFMSLSGGEKRLIELVKIIYSRADLVLMDEPTNHMDYIAKKIFIDWLSNYQGGIIVISHDRDVLEVVDKIIELKQNGELSEFSGNYDDYLTQNLGSTVTEIGSYAVSLKRIDRLKSQIQQAKKTFGTSKAGTIVIARFTKELEMVQRNLKRPDFWIDQESLANVSSKISEKYDEFKSKSIKVSVQASSKKPVNYQLVKLEKVVVGYDKPLFEPLSFQLFHGDKLRLHGRNGAGKSTLIKSIIYQYQNSKPSKTLLSGEITLHPALVIGIYEQEFSQAQMDLTLGQIIKQYYADLKLDCSDQTLSVVLSQYLFDPVNDRHLLLKHASGGQKSRIQIIKMLLNKPNLLILDEPTNHLDLPSIEELEKNILKFDGAVIYVSHDTYFQRNIGGKVIVID